MTDGFGRTIDYLRISVTDLCNLRCVYCMPTGGIEKRPHREILSIEELITAAQAAADCGVTKIRITGGEPLVRRGIVDLVRGISAIPSLREVCMTTNGVLLPDLAGPLKEAGLSRLNVSLDTLDPDKYAAVTRVGRLDDVLAGLNAAEAAGFTGTKLNAVLIGGLNDDELPQLVGLTEERDLELRFIELMPIGECAHWDKSRFIPGEAVLKAVPALEPVGQSGVARLYQVPGWKGRVGLIDPISHRFCEQCNRIRITADGKIKPCLHSAGEFDLKGLDRAGMREVLRRAILSKPGRHSLSEQGSESLRNMNEIGG